MNSCDTKNTMSDEKNFCDTKNRGRGRPPLGGQQLHVTLRFRTGRSEGEDHLFERLQELGARGQRSRYIRKVLLTGDIEPILDRIFEEESEIVQSRLDDMFNLWEEDEDD
jgi:hypothetical protein